MIKSFQNFLSKEDLPKKNSDAAGIAVILGKENPKILLVHPTNSSWARATMGIPKGKMEPGESPKEAAFREFKEETSIEILPTQVEPAINTVDIWKGETFKNHLFYLVCRIDSPSDLGLTGELVPKDMLQLAEIDWAGFVSIEEAYAKISASQRIILDRLR